MEPVMEPFDLQMLQSAFRDIKSILIKLSKFIYPLKNALSQHLHNI